MNNIRNRYLELLFCGDKQLSDGHMRGSYQIGSTGYTASYTLNVQPLGAAYPVRGTVSLRIKDGSVGKLETGARKRKRKESYQQRAGEKEPRADTYDMTKRVTVKTASAEDCREAVADAAWAIYQANEKQLKGGTQYLRTDELSFAELFTRFDSDFLNAASKTAGGQDVRRRRLKKVAQLLDNTPIGKISSRQLKRLCDELGKTWPDYLKDASALVAYAHQQRLDGSGDMFAEYLQHNRPRKERDTDALQEKAKRQSVLTQEQNEALRKLILTHPENGEYIGVALVRWAGLNVPAACALPLRDIQPMEVTSELLYINYCIEGNAGSTHDYSFPALPALTEIIAARRQYLMEQGIDPDEVTVASGRDPTKPLDRDELTRVCRNLTRDLGIENGAGVKILTDSYRNDLANCGLREDSGAYKFLLHQALTNLVQADHYRCFTDESARYYLATMLLRARPKQKLATKSKQVHVENNDGVIRTTASPLTTKDTVKLSYRVKFEKGETLTCRADHGVMVSVRPVEKA